MLLWWFWYIDWVTFALLNIIGRWCSFFVLRLKMISWACLTGSGLQFIFHWRAQLCIISKSLFADVWLSWKTQNKDVSSANNLALVKSPSERFILIQIKNNNGPRMELWGAPAVTFVQVETWSLRTTHCLLSLIKCKSLSKFPDIPFSVNLKTLPSRQILLNAFEMSRKRPL